MEIWSTFSSLLFGEKKDRDTHQEGQTSTESLNSSTITSNNLTPNVTDETIYNWMQKLNHDALSVEHFKEHWAAWVPKIYGLEPTTDCLEWNFDEKKSQEIFYDSLEKFIYNGNEISQHPTVCGKIINKGESYYNCRECEAKSSSLCTECFEKSDHINHKYRIKFSNGYSYCDCGDEEVWKREPCCEIHAVGAESKDAFSKKLPEDVVERARITFEAVLTYCYDSLLMDHNQSPDVSSSENSDTYCTIILEDKVYTFDEMINFLTSVTKCSKKDAVKYEAIIDRQGRAVLKCSDFQSCNELKAEVEKFYSEKNCLPKVRVEKSHVVSQQIFSIKLLEWLEKFIRKCDDFRVIFSEVALSSTTTGSSNVEKVLIKNNEFWKAARICWIRLYISGFLTRPESRKALAIVFAKNYDKIMRDFVHDTYDHTSSIASLSMHLFSAPTLSHFLMENLDAWSILLNTFISESSPWCSPDGKIENTEEATKRRLERAYYTLFDIKCLLSEKPETWTDNLRSIFLQNFDLFLQVLSSMKKLNAVTKNEQKWYSTLLSRIICLVLEWCGSDRVVFIASFQIVLTELGKQTIKSTTFRKVADQGAACIDSEELKEPNFFYLSLSRCLAGLFLHLKKFDLNFDGPDFQMNNKISLVEIIDTALHTQVMIAQANGGLRKQNSSSTENKINIHSHAFYCSELLEKDIILLQIGAAHTESNEFVIHILNKFNLMNWAQEDHENTLDSADEDTIQQTINLVEEFLEILIQIIGERYVPSIAEITSKDCIKYELIQQLCIKSLKHSELINTQAIASDKIPETGIVQSIIDEIANVKKYQITRRDRTITTKCNVYELKSEFYSKHNVFFSHYTKEESSKSEETQRLRLKEIGALECCPPPKLPKLQKMFESMINLLQCDVMLSIFKTVLSRALNLEAKSFSESQVHRVLHLIGYALQEQESKNYKFLTFTERAAKLEIYNLLRDLQSSPRIVAYKDLLTWVLEKYRLVAGYPPVDIESATLQISKPEDSNKGIVQESPLQKISQNLKFMTAKVNKGQLEIPVALGPCQTTRRPLKWQLKCVICQKTQDSKVDDSTMVYAAYVQRSKTLCQQNSQRIDETTHLFLSSSLETSPFTRTCFHMMHATCWKKYYDKIVAEEKQRPDRLLQPVNFDINKGEFLCPTPNCNRSICNIVMPILPSLGYLQPIKSNQPDLSFDRWLDFMNSIVRCKKPSEGIKTDLDENCRYCRYLSQQKSGTDSDVPNNPQKILKFFTCPIGAIKSEGPDGKFIIDLYNQPGPKLSKNLEEMVSLFLQRTLSKGLGCDDPNKDDPRLPLLAWKSTAYTILSSKQTFSTGEKVSSFPTVGFWEEVNLQILAKISAIIGSMTSGSPTFANYALDSLECFFNNSESNHSILSWDPFGMLVTLVLALPNLLSYRSDFSPVIITGNVVEQHTVRLVFTALVVKILLISDFDGCEKTDEQDHDLISTFEMINMQDESDALFKLMEALNIPTWKSSPSEIWNRVKECCKPFLQCCVLFFNYLTDVPKPPGFTRTDGDTFENMCKYLGLPETYTELFNSEKVLKLAVEWSKHPGMAIKDKTTNGFLKEKRLVDLPEDYRDLVRKVSKFTCPNSGEISMHPLMCLICGEILCSDCYRCRFELKDGTLVGASTYHATECNAGLGVFVKICEGGTILLESQNLRHRIKSFYIDEFGESDQGLQRFLPLKLCNDEYGQCNALYTLNHMEPATKRFGKIFNWANQCVVKPSEPLNICDR